MANGGRGLAVVTAGTKEATVIDDAERTLALTLFRSTGAYQFVVENTGSQALEEMIFPLRLVPLDGSTNPIALARHAIDLQAGGRMKLVEEADRVRFAGGTIGPALAPGLVAMSGAVVSSVRCLAGDLEVRVFNPSRESGLVVIEPNAAFVLVSARRVDLAGGEDADGDLDFADRAVHASLRPKEIATFRLRLEVAAAEAKSFDGAAVATNSRLETLRL